ncbi:MAG TPA: polysaccharide biosynthesis tyrosine autokinase [Opitutales bacterium]|nr:polysaccharide biosynthesis tyrosine autokinase [Opitutales bacterium]
MPTPVTESSEGGQHVEWSETFHAFLFRARIYLKRFGWIILITAGLGALLQVLKTRDVPPTYYSDAEMMVGMQISSGGTGGPTTNEPTLYYFATQVHNLKNSNLAAKAYDDAYKQMPAGTPKPWAAVDPTFLPSTLILQLHAIGSDPKFTQLYLQSLMEEFLAEKDQTRKLSLNGYGLNLKDAVSEYEKKINDLMAEQNDFVSKNNLADLPNTIEATNTKLNKDIEQQMELETKLGKLETPKKPPVLLDGAPAAPAAPAPAGNATAASGSDTVFNHRMVVPQPGEQMKLMESEPFKSYVVNGANVEALDGEWARYDLLPIGPDYQREKTARTQLTTQRDQLLSGGLSEGHPLLVRLQSSLKTIDGDLEILRKQRVDNLEEIKTGIELQLNDVNDQEKQLLSKILDLQTVKNELDKKETMIQMNKDVLSKAIALTVALPEASKLDQELLTISSPASAAQVVPQNPGAKILQGVLVGFVAGVLIVFLLGALDGRVMSIEDLTQRFDEPMLGVIPMQQRTNGQVELLKNNDQRQQFAESCRNIRSSLLYMDRHGQRPRVIMLTSSMPSEGKSTLSANLAITLGFASSRTLLVDADMRRGQLHKRFGLKNDRGLAEHIQDGLSLDEVIQPTKSENLDFISCGHYPMQPGELLMSERFRESIQALRQRYDFVIFDSPPILLTDDAASFATRADAVVFVVRAGYTRLRQVRTSLESLTRRGVNVYGMVVNFIDLREPGYYSYRYYDYYSYRPNRTAT